MSSFLVIKMFALRIIVPKELKKGLQKYKIDVGNIGTSYYYTWVIFINY